MDIKQLLKGIEKEHSETEIRIAELTEKIAQLTAAGCWTGKEYWTGKDKKYLYILKPMRDGKRKKVYIGNQEYKIEDARAKLARYEERLHLIDQLTKYELKRDKIVAGLKAVYEGNNWMFGFDY